MANLRVLKKEIDYRLEELVFDCDMAIYFQPAKDKEIFAVMQQGVELRNALYTKANRIQSSLASTRQQWICLQTRSLTL